MTKSNPTSSGIFASGLAWLRDRAEASRVVGRALTLVAVLVFVKLLLVAQVSEQIFESHWRVSPRSPKWFDYLNLGAFLALLLLSFFRLGRQARAWESWTIRRLNLAFIGMGFLFAFFSFQQMDKAYLVPVVEGVLSLGDVWAYLSLNLFFAPPWLAAYLLVYPLAYWWMASRGREAWSLPVLGVIATAYVLVYLRDLVKQGDALLVVNCFGLACLAGESGSRRGFSWRAVAGVLALPVLAWIGFARYDEQLARPGAYFVLLLAISLTVALVLYLAARGTAARGALNHRLPFFFIAFFLLSNCHHPLAPNYANWIQFGLTLPWYVMWEVLSVGVLIMGVLALPTGRPWLARTVFDFGALALVAVAIVDLLLTRQMGIRLDWNVLTMNTDPRMIWKTIRPFLPLLGLGLITLVATYAAGVWVAGRLVQQRATRGDLSGGGWKPGFAVTLALLLLAVAPLLRQTDKASGSGVTRLVASSPWVRGFAVERLPVNLFREKAAEIGLPLRSTAAAVGIDRPSQLNVLLIITESSYNRYLSLFGAPDETQPLLGRYRERMELFPNFFSNFPNSFHARFSILNGLYAPQEYVSHLNPRIACPSLFEILNDHGYVNSLYYSSTRHYTALQDYLGHRRLDVFHDCDSMPGREQFQKVSWGIEETATLRAMQTRLRDHASRRERFCLTYIPAAPHMPYDAPSREFEKFDNGIGALDNNYSGRYKNQLLYMDWILASLLETLSEQKLLDETIVLITNDHGEMVGEDDGKLGHGWNLEPRLGNSPLIIMDPRRPGYQVNRTFGSQVDVLPTLLQLLGVPLPAGELYQGVSLHSEAASNDRSIYLHSYKQRALVRGGQYFLLDPESSGGARGPAEVYDIRNDGVKTIFEKTGATADISVQHEEFVRFQKSLIIHYARYREELAADPPAGKSAPTGLSVAEKAVP